MSTRAIYWFVEPNDANTNEIIAKNLLAVGGLDENVSLSDEEGEEHSVFEINSYRFITELYKDRHKFNLRFKVFRREGHSRILRLWRFGTTKKKKMLKNKR